MSKARDDEIDRRFDEFLRENPMPPFYATLDEIRALMRALYGSDEEVSKIKTQKLAEEVLKELRGEWRLRVVSETKFTEEMAKARAERVYRLKKELRRD
jgi:hypothetical protein